MPPQASEAFYATLQRLQVVLVLAGRRAWSGMRPDFDPSWAEIAPALVQVTSAAQLAAATAATSYVPAVLDETGQQAPAEARVKPQAFVGTASDGRSLLGLLDGAVVRSKAAAATGMDPAEALLRGGNWLDMALQTILTDAARDATAAEIAVRPTVGWVRMVNPPCCSRCAALAGKWYRWNQGFPRHPRCDCVHIPATENRGGDFVTDPGALANRGLITDLTQAQRKRLDDGADLTKVLNESRDAWRVRMAAERKAAKAQQRWATSQPLPPGGVQDFLSRLTSRVDAIAQMRDHGLVT